MQRRSFISIAGIGITAIAQGAWANRGTNVIKNGPVVPTKEHPLGLHFNENSLGISPKAQEAIQASLTRVTRYAHLEYGQLTDIIAKHWGVAQNQIGLTAGSSEFLYSIVFAKVQRARQTNQRITFIAPTPTFSIISDACKAVGAMYRSVPLQEKTLRMDWEGLKAAVREVKGLAVVYICNPNNPTGVVRSKRDVFSWIRSAAKEQPNVFFIVDRAYAEYVENPAFASGIDLVKRGYTNLAVTRTFSKVYGLAGLRVGYGVADTNVVQKIMVHLTGFDVSRPAFEAAKASLLDTRFVKRSLASNRASRAIVVRTLKTLGWEYAQGEGNFIFHRVPETTYAQKLHEHHIIVGRPFPPYDLWNRLTLGTPEEMKAWQKAVLAIYG